MQRSIAQYRMHPAISLFPRAAFYDAKLQDGPNVKLPAYTKEYHKVQDAQYIRTQGGCVLRCYAKLALVQNVS